MIIKIGALGMENSIRGKKDGYAYFGYQEDVHTETVNDLFNEIAANY
jgi:hypothetical protein